MRKDSKWPLLLLVLALIIPLKLSAQTDEAGITLLPPRSGDESSGALAVNNNGESVGFSNGSSGVYAVMWDDNGNVTDLGFGSGSEAYSINDSGQVLVLAPHIANPIIWSGGTTQILANFYVLSNPTYGPFPHINNSGQVAGYITQNGTNIVAIYNVNNGSITTLGAPPGSTASPVSAVGTEVNALGHVIEAYGGNFYNGSSWVNIIPPNLGFTPNSGNDVELTGLNDSDEVVGMGSSNGVWEAFSWSPISGFHLLGPLFATAVNNNGIVTGQENGAGPTINLPGSGPVGLNSAILGPIAELYTTFENFNVASGINNNNQIVGYGSSKGYFSAVGFLLPPLGSSQFFPFLGQGASGSSWLFAIGSFLFGDLDGTYALYFLWVDPPIAGGFHYAMQNNSLFTEIANFPVGFSNSFTVSVNGTILGQFGRGQSVLFTNYAEQLGSALVSNTGVAQFDVSGIKPLVDPTNQIGFPLEIGFSDTNAIFVMSPILPVLNISPSATNIALSWPYLLTGWTLQTNNDLKSGAWGDYTGPVVNNSVTNVRPAGVRFYRLKYP